MSPPTAASMIMVVILQALYLSFLEYGTRTALSIDDLNFNAASTIFATLSSHGSSYANKTPSLGSIPTTHWPLASSVISEVSAEICHATAFPSFPTSSTFVSVVASSTSIPIAAVATNGFSLPSLELEPIVTSIAIAAEATNGFSLPSLELEPIVTSYFTDYLIGVIALGYFGAFLYLYLSSEVPVQPDEILEVVEALALLPELPSGLVAFGEPLTREDLMAPSNRESWPTLSLVVTTLNESPSPPSSSVLSALTTSAIVTTIDLASVVPTIPVPSSVPCELTTSAVVTTYNLASVAPATPAPSQVIGYSQITTTYEVEPLAPTMEVEVTNLRSEIAELKKTVAAAELSMKCDAAAQFSISKVVTTVDESPIALKASGPAQCSLSMVLTTFDEEPIDPTIEDAFDALGQEFADLQDESSELKVEIASLRSGVIELKETVAAAELSMLSIKSAHAAATKAAQETFANLSHSMEEAEALASTRLKEIIGLNKTVVGLNGRLKGDMSQSPEWDSSVGDDESSRKEANAPVGQQACSIEVSTSEKLSYTSDASDQSPGNPQSQQTYSIEVPTLEKLFDASDAGNLSPDNSQSPDCALSVEDEANAPVEQQAYSIEVPTSEKLFYISDASDQSTPDNPPPPVQPLLPAKVDWADEMNEVAEAERATPPTVPSDGIEIPTTESENPIPTIENVGAIDEEAALPLSKSRKQVRHESWRKPRQAEAAAMAPTLDDVLKQAPGRFVTTLFIGNLSQRDPGYQIGKDLPMMFSRFGRVIETRCKAGQQFAFVRMSTHKEAAMAIHEMDGLPFEGSPLRCQWEKAKDHPSKVGKEVAAVDEEPVVMVDAMPPAENAWGTPLVILPDAAFEQQPDASNLPEELLTEIEKNFLVAGYNCFGEAHQRDIREDCGATCTDFDQHISIQTHDNCYFRDLRTGFVEYLIDRELACLVRCDHFRENPTFKKAVLFLDRLRSDDEHPILNNDATPAKVLEDLMSNLTYARRVFPKTNAWLHKMMLKKPSVGPNRDGWTQLWKSPFVLEHITMQQYNKIFRLPSLEPLAPPGQEPDLAVSN